MLPPVFPGPDQAAGPPALGVAPGPAAEGVSIVIRTLDEALALPATLRAIRRQRFAAPVEVVVVDSGSTDGTVALAEEGGARVVSLGAAYRPGLASNTGIAAARHPVCVLLSAAAFPVGDRWLADLVAPLANPGVAASFSRQVAVPGASPIEEAFLRRTFRPRSTTATFSATSAALRRDVWERIRFDEAIASGGPDDRDWWARVTADGLRVVYAADSVVARSHGLDLSGWFYRVREDARAERAIAAFAGRPSAPTGSAAGLALATVGGLLRARAWRDVARYLLLAPLLAGARLQARRMAAPGGRSRVVDQLNRIDTRLFAPRARAAAAVRAHLAGYWALRPGEGP